MFHSASQGIFTKAETRIFVPSVDRRCWIEDEDNAAEFRIGGVYQIWDVFLWSSDSQV